MAMSEGSGKSSVEVPSESKSKKPKKTLIIAAVATVIVVIIILAIIMSPQYSPLASVHDADGDGVADDEDIFPNDASEWADTDSDDYGDNGDAFPSDSDEWLDTDSDGYGDNTDEFPNDDEEWEDTDGDGYGDNGDAFPNDPDEWLDTDGDGVGDNADAFPTDSTQWADRDDDGYGDNPLGIDPDAFPDDPTEWKDSDSDGIGDNSDFYDSGNGKVKIAINSYQGDGTADFWTFGDPFFVIRVDVNNDGTYDLTYTSSIFVDTELLTSPYSVTVDLTDGTAAFRFWISVYDSDLEGDYVIDYAPSSSGTSVSHAVFPPFAGSWSYNGSDDGLSETDCILDYSLSVTS